MSYGPVTERDRIENTVTALAALAGTAVVATVGVTLVKTVAESVFAHLPEEPVLRGICIGAMTIVALPSATMFTAGLVRNALYPLSELMQ